MRAPQSQTQAHRLLGHIALSLLVFTVAAFGLKAAIHTEVQARYTPLVIVHGLAMLGWLGLLTGQAYLASIGRLSMHRTLGKSSLIIVAIMTITGMILAVNIGEELGRPEVAIVNIAAFATFLPLYVLALYWAHRRRIHEHRQAMLIGTLALMTPAYARVVQVMELPDPLAIMIQLPLTIAIAGWFDWKVLGRLSKPVLAMLAYSIAVIAVMGAVLVVFFLPALLAQIR